MINLILFFAFIIQNFLRMYANVVWFPPCSVQAFVSLIMRFARWLSFGMIYWCFSLFIRFDPVNLHPSLSKPFASTNDVRGSKFLADFFYAVGLYHLQNIVVVCFWYVFVRSLLAPLVLMVWFLCVLFCSF